MLTGFQTIANSEPGNLCLSSFKKLIMTKTIVLSTILAAGFLTSISLPAQEKTTAKKLWSDTGSGTKTVITNDGESNIDVTEDGRHYRMRMSGSKLTELYIGNLQIAREDFPKYDTLVNRLLKQIEIEKTRADKDRQKALNERAVMNKSREQAELYRTQAESERQLLIQERKQLHEERSTIQNTRKGMDEERVTTDQMRKAIDEERSSSDSKQKVIEEGRAKLQHKKKLTDEDRSQPHENKDQAETDRENAQNDREHSNAERNRAVLDRQKTEEQRRAVAIDRRKAETDRKMLDELFEDLIADKMIDRRQAIRSFTLNDEQLQLNGVKQPANIHEKYKMKYLNADHKAINYRSIDGTTQLSFN
jgi:hypothetical protein